MPRYELLERQMAKARRRRNFERYAQLKAAQQALTRYQPEMMHSPDDNSKRVVFHPQLLSGFNVICDLAQRLNEALDSEPRATIQRKFWRSIFALQERARRAWLSVAGGSL